MLLLVASLVCHPHWLLIRGGHRSAERERAESQAAQLEEELARLCRDLDAKGKDLDSQWEEVERLRKEGEQLEQSGLAGANHLFSLAGKLVGRVFVHLTDWVNLFVASYVLKGCVVVQVLLALLLLSTALKAPTPSMVL